jgi:hypothetical protein
VLYAEYLPLLLNDIYYKEIPYKTLQKDDFWLQNPEQELDKLAEINKKHRIDDDSIKQIQNYFLKRHAVLNALKINAGSLFIPIIATSALAGLLFLINWVCWLNDVYKYTTWIWGAGVFFFASSLVMLATKKNFVNMIMPRIFVAVLSILFVLIGAEELFTRMIDVKTFGVIITAFLCLVIVTFFLFSESRQHSPAYKVSLHPKMYDIKITPILLHAFNFANVLVLGLQLVIMPRMVERSDYIKSDIFASKLNEIEYTLQDCEEYSKNAFGLDQYDNVLLSVGNTRTDGSTLIKRDSTTTILSVKLINSLPTIKQLQEKNEKYKDRLELDRYVYLKKHLETMINDSLKAIELHEVNPEDALNSIEISIAKGRVVDDLRSDLLTFYRFMQQDSILKEICTYQPDTTLITSIYPFNSPFSKKYGFKYEPKDVIMIKPLKRDCFTNRLFDDKTKDETLLYPTLMIMQVCISLLLSIVGQLIISDKTVTEAL